MTTKELLHPSKTTHRAPEKGKETPFFKPETVKGDAFFGTGGASAATSAPVQKKQEKTGNLPDAIQQKMETSLGADFSDVNVHTNSTSAKELDAIAYTQGNDIHFAPGYNPYSGKGEEYLGHELTHVVQQSAGMVETTHREGNFNVNDNAGLENQADVAGRKAAAGEHAGLGIGTSATAGKSTVQKKDAATIQLLREPIPASAFILEVNASPDTVLQQLINTAYATSRQASDVNWRQIFYPMIESQIRGRQLGSISHAWTDTEGLDADWEVNISFSMQNAVATGRTDSRQVSNTQGGGSTPSLGSSQTVTTGQTAGGQVSGTNAPGGVGTGGNVSVSANDATARGQSQGAGGSITGGQSQTSAETVRRFRSELIATIDVNCTAGYSNWDIINPVKWGAHLAGNLHETRVVNVGSLTYDKPNY